MFRRLRTWLACWYRTNRNYRKPRRISSYRASSTVEKLYASGTLQSSRMTGNPLARDCQ